MSWTNRMARHGSERSLHTLHAVHSPPALTSRRSTVTPDGEPSSAPSSLSPCADSRTTVKVSANNGNGNSSSSSSGVHVASSSSSASSASSSWDSRIPRPSPTGLRRSASMRMRGERPSAAAVSCSAAAVSGTSRQQQQYQYRRNGQHHLLHHQQQHSQHTDNRIFPVITENGTDSPRQRSLSLSLTPARPRPGHAALGGSSAAIGDDSDAESVKSYGSACSTASACDHAIFALNGTTWSGRSRKYVVHCSNHNGDNEQYLTPTQRAARQVRKLQSLLKDARKEIEDKDREILRLTKEVVELRLYKASLNSPDERTDSSDALTVRENNPFSPESPSKELPAESVLPKSTSPESPGKRVQSDHPSSLEDSGHFDDGSVHSKDSTYVQEARPVASNVPATPESSNVRSVSDASRSEAYARSAVDSPEREEERCRLVDLYEGRIEEMHRRHIDEVQELKQKHNDKVESLLNQLAEVNTRYCEVRPAMDAAEARARELETELEAVKAELAEQKTLLDDQEERNKQMYLKMYAKGQEAARIEQADQILEQAHQMPPTVSVAQLLQQLTVTQAELDNIKDTSYSPEPHISAARYPSLLSAQEAVSLWVLGTRKAMYRRIVEARSKQGTLDPEITLQFLKSAIYYFLTDKENHQGHLNAIESILGFSEAEKHNIDKIYRSARK